MAGFQVIIYGRIWVITEDCLFHSHPRQQIVDNSGILLDPYRQKSSYCRENQSRLDRNQAEVQDQNV